MGIKKLAKRAVKGALKATPLGRAVSVGASAVGALRGRRKGGGRRRSRGLTMSFLRNYKIRLIKTKLKARLMKEELKAFKGL